MCAIGTSRLRNGLTKVQNANGFIDLTKVKYVRTVKRKPEGQDAGVGQGESVDFHAAELRLPSVKRSWTDAVVPAEILGSDAGLVLFENGDDLRLGEPGLFHWWSPSRPVASEFSTHFRSLFQATRHLVQIPRIPRRLLHPSGQGT